MSTKKNVQENALLEVSDEELAQFSGGDGIVSSLPVVGPTVDSTVGSIAGPVVGTLTGTQADLTIPSPIGVISLSKR